ncbi:GlxA family transcriptional regulator [Glycomyces harbinensis]|uniref:Transcriptional regulator GlxA family, contains an amidase domain and an AraC-type DNA-binding HTH domain n=1 Tax=Glycomyces harbinensis TaxID=58114 RepID=A0A1G7DG80_9ACTN|nr:helix-turn-helix domain-containing protein [Glycomyces harbinensis]SDE49805.1 Transcriptional regulator GlxA family, contains an amidase domain and an AraC-type DNA-binding HTH domain [Glycomyces harbinensis]
MHLVSVLAMDHVVGFELATAGQVFGSARSMDGRDAPLYSVRVCGPGRVQVSAAGDALFTMTPPYGLGELLEADTIVVPAHDSSGPVPPDVVAALRRANEQGRRIASICTGAGILAEAGLLDGRDATTHWRHAAALSARFPRVRFDAAALYIDGGDVLTSAGVAAGVDLCLHMIRMDHGAAVAAQAARRLVMSPHRSGGQAQFIASDRAVTDEGSLAEIMQWMTANLDRPLTLAEIGRRAGLSIRTLNRHFHDQTGSAPMQWLLAKRVQRAQELLEGTTLSIEEIARRSGFGGAAALRQHFRLQLATTPTSYRRQFSSS